MADHQITSRRLELNEMTRSELQSLAMSYTLRGNLSNAQIIDAVIMLENGERPPDHLFKGGVTKQAMTFIVDNKNAIPHANHSMWYCILHRTGNKSMLRSFGRTADD